MYVQGVGYGWWVQVVAVPTTGDGFWLSGCPPGCLWLSLGISGWVTPVCPAPFQPQDPATVSPSFQPVRVGNHARGGPA